MKPILLILFIAFATTLSAQDTTNTNCNCPPLPVTRPAVQIDTDFVRHSIAKRYTQYDNKRKKIVVTMDFDSSFAHSGDFVLAEDYDARYDYYYDTSGVLIYAIKTKRTVTIECFHKFSYSSNGKLLYKEGCQDGVAVRMSYEYEESGKLIKRTTTKLEQ